MQKNVSNVDKLKPTELQQIKQLVEPIASIKGTKVRLERFSQAAK